MPHAKVVRKLGFECRHFLAQNEPAACEHTRYRGFNLGTISGEMASRLGARPTSDLVKS